MTVRKVTIPEESEIASYLPDASFSDAYQVTVPTKNLSPEVSYHAIMSSMPDWFRNLFKLRNKIVRPFGLIAPKSDKVDQMVARSSYEVGDRINVFSFYGRSENEVVTGADDKHLDFRLSVLRIKGNKLDRVTVITLVKTHNIFGKVYLRSILPFHEMGVRALLRNAAADKL